MRRLLLPLMCRTQNAVALLRRRSHYVRGILRQDPHVIVGYARVSTPEQEAGLAAQIAELAGAGCTKTFQEQASSVAQRNVLAGCLSFLREGDVLMVTTPD